MNNQQLNEVVAERLELKSFWDDGGWRGDAGPATDPAAALWAAKECCKKFNLDVQIGWNIATDNHWCQMNHSGSLALYINEIGKTFQLAICLAIVEAA